MTEQSQQLSESRDRRRAYVPPRAEFVALRLEERLLSCPKQPNPQGKCPGTGGDAGWGS